MLYLSIGFFLFYLLPKWFIGLPEYSDSASHQSSNICSHYLWICHYLALLILSLGNSDWIQKAPPKKEKILIRLTKISILISVHQKILIRK